MNRWDRFTWQSGPKKPPPEHGIKMKKAGTTWWGQRWIEALEHLLGGDAGRLSRGRTYARAGRTHDLVIDGGTVKAKVTGSRAEPYEITIALAQLDDAAWERAIAEMAAKAQFSAELLAGEMPQRIDDAFHAAKISLFPRTRADLDTDCSCPDWGDPCKHVAATHYVLGEALDRDPFLLFELRGRKKDAVLSALRAARGGDVAEAPDDREGAPAIPKVTLKKPKAKDYDAPKSALPSPAFSFDEPVAHGALLQQLGAPAAWSGERPPAEMLSPLVRAAAERARAIALADPRVEPPQAAPKKKARARKK